MLPRHPPDLYVSGGQVHCVHWMSLPTVVAFPCVQLAMRYWSTGQTLVQVDTLGPVKVEQTEVTYCPLPIETLEQGSHDSAVADLLQLQHGLK